MDTKTTEKEPSSSSTQPESASRLRVGDVFLKDGVKHVIWFINPSRASIAPLDGPHLVHRTRESDGKIQFMCTNPKLQSDISPGSELEIVEKLGREGLATYINDHKQAKTKAAAKTTSRTAKTKKPEKKAKTAKTKKEKPETNGTPGIRAGSLGTYCGYSIASVVRALGKAGWNFREVRTWINASKLKAGDQTIKINLYRAHHDERPDSGVPAPLTKEQMPDKPEIEEKKKTVAAAAPKKAKAASKKAPAKKVKTTKSQTEKPTKSRAAEQIAALKKPASAEARA